MSIAYQCEMSLHDRKSTRPCRENFLSQRTNHLITTPVFKNKKSNVSLSVIVINNNDSSDLGKKVTGNCFWD